MSADHAKTILDQAEEAAELAQTAFATGDRVTGIAAIILAAQLLQLAKTWPPPRSGVAA